MGKLERGFSRRRTLGMTFGVGGFVLTGGIRLLSAQELKRQLTPAVEIEPFYPVLKPLDVDADLTALAGNRGRAEGRIIHLTGRVLNERGEPISGAKVEIWHAKARGRYSHPSDPNPAPPDPNFQGYGIQTTDAQVRYRFKTIKPGGYPASQDWTRPPHIHVDVSGKVDRLVTQMFFPGEPLNERDGVFQALGADKTAAVAGMPPPTKETEADALLLAYDLAYDIVLLKG